MEYSQPICAYKNYAKSPSLWVQKEAAPHTVHPQAPAFQNARSTSNCLSRLITTQPKSCQPSPPAETKVGRGRRGAYKAASPTELKQGARHAVMSFPDLLGLCLGCGLPIWRTELGIERNHDQNDCQGREVEPLLDPVYCFPPVRKGGVSFFPAPYTVRTSSSANELHEAQRVKATPGNVVVQEYTRREIGGCFARQSCFSFASGGRNANDFLFSWRSSEANSIYQCKMEA